MKTHTFLISLILMMLAATMFAQHSDKELVNKDNYPNNQQILKDDVGHEIPYCSSNQFKTPETKSKDDKNLVVMWDNGSFITHPLLGPEFTDLSILQDTSLGMGTSGYGGQISAGNSIADDFVVTGSWNISQIVFYAYQTGSGPQSTINDVRVQVYDDDPSDGGQVIWGDLSTNVLLTTEWTEVWRVRESDINQDRPIMRVLAETDGLVVSSGTYWVEFSVGGTGASGPWVPPVTIFGETTTGNAMQYTSASSGWAPLMDIGPQGFPFRVEGNTTPQVDVLLSEISEPESGFNLTDAEDVKIKITNGWFGQPEYNIPIEVYFNGPTGWGMFKDTVAGPVLPDSTLMTTLTETVDFSSLGDYAIQVCTALPGDWDPYNNCLTKFVTNCNSQPSIEINPLAFEETHINPPQITTQTLAIYNTGNAPLTWNLNMGRRDRSNKSTLPSPQNRAVIWDNGPIITAQGVGSNGSDYSELQDASLGMGTYGIGCQISAENTLADDFEITGWHNLAYITFYAYQTGSGPPSTITDVRFQIYDGDPSVGGEVIFGDLTTNRLLSTQWSNIWRVLESGPTENRPIMEVVADANCCYLTTGTYWVEFQMEGSGASGPWCSAVTIPGISNTGNAMQHTASGIWEPIIDVGTQGIPFTIDAYLGGPEYDVGISAILEPASGVSFTNEEPVTIRLENFGAAGQSDIPYEVSWSGPTGSETVNGVHGSYLMCGQYVDITLDETADLSAPGTYLFEACTLLEEDENPDNDCKIKALVGPEPGNEWLWFDISSGIINPGDTTFVSFNFDSETLMSGQYLDTIQLGSNDPDQPLIFIPVQLNVEIELIPPANLMAEHLGMGEVQLSWVYYPTKDLEHFNLYRDDTLIGTSQDTTVTDMLPGFGSYTYKVTAQYSEGESEPAGPVIVEWLAEPHIVIDPLELNEIHFCAPQITTKSLIVSNTGTTTLDWELYIENEDLSEIAGSALNTNNKTKNRDDLPWEDMYSSGCIYGDGLIYWNLENVLVPEIPCEGNPPWYHDYKDQVHLLEPGNTYSLTVQAGYDQTYFDVWINYNDDWYALDNELVLDDAYCPNANQDYTFTISIPDTATPGEHTLRFRTNWIDPVTHYFEKYSYGNCCDFTANISNNVSWLQADISSGTIEPGQSREVVFTFNSLDLQLGFFSASVNFFSNDPGNPLVEIPAALLATESEISYTWDPQSFEFEFYITEDPGMDYLEIENVGTDTLQVAFEIEYPESSKDEWLSIYPTTGSIAPGDAQIFEVAVYFEYLTNYHCEANIILLANDPCFPSQLIPVSVDVIGAVDEINGSGFDIFPNPSKFKVNISSKQQIRKISLMDQLGLLCLEKRVDGKTAALETADLPKGIYIVKIESDEGESFHKLILQ